MYKEIVQVADTLATGLNIRGSTADNVEVGPLRLARHLLDKVDAPALIKMADIANLEAPDTVVGKARRLRAGGNGIGAVSGDMDLAASSG